MKRYLLIIFCFGVCSFSFVSAQSEDSFDSTSSCQVFFGDSANFGAQKIDMEYTKQQLKLLINDAYAKLSSSSNKKEKDMLKDQIYAWKKEIMRLNYRLFMLYKNEYFSRISN